MVVLTDVHGWVMGHGGHESSSSPFDADYGDVLSFYQRLRELVDGFDLGNDDSPPDLYLVMNGDFLHGTLLGADPPHYLPGILSSLPYDAVTVGEHELKNSDSLAVLREPGGLFDEWWGDGTLVTSNVRVVRADDDANDVDKSPDFDSAPAPASLPLGRNYKILRGNHGTVLVLGFLYEIEMAVVDKSGDEAVVVERVEDVLRELWFASLFADDYSPTPTTPTPSALAFDAVLVMAHMDARDELISVVHDALRLRVGPDIAVHFVAGHTHLRAYETMDDSSSSFQAGRYLETVGFLSFDPRVANSTEHVFVDANRASLAQSLGAVATKGGDEGGGGGDNVVDDDFATEDGAKLSRYIRRTMDHSGANEALGCADLRYRADGRLDEKDSLFRLYLERVLPASSFLRRANEDRKSSHHHSSHAEKKVVEEDVFVQYLDWPAVRYDLFPGVVTMNDIYAVVPEDDTIVTVGHSIDGRIVTEIIQRMNADNATDAVGVALGGSDSSSHAAESSSASLSLTYGIQEGSTYTLHTLARNAPAVQDLMIELDAPVKSPSGKVVKPQSTRSLWIDFIRREWPYDGKQCQCLREEDGCRINADDPFATTASSGDGAGGSNGGSSTSGKSGTALGNATTSKSHGGGSKHVSSAPKSKNSHHQSKSSEGHSNAVVFLVMVVAGAVFFVMLRNRRRGAVSRGRRELEGTNDLQLRQESAAPGAYGKPTGAYSSPAMPFGGAYA